MSRNIKAFDEFYSQEEVEGFMKDNGLSAGQLAEVRRTIIGMLRDGDKGATVFGVKFISEIDPEHDMTLILDPYNAVVGTAFNN